MGENNQRIGRARPKSRDNWLGACLKFDCDHERCSNCLRFDMYREEEDTDEEVE